MPGEKRGHVEADSARADDGDARTGLPSATQQIRIADDLLVIDAWNCRQSRPHAGRDDDLVKLPTDNLLHRRLRVQSHVNAKPAELDSEVAQRLVELLLAGHLARVPELAADLGILFEQRDSVPPLC